MISKRLQVIASLIPPAKTIADIGCDHGYVIKEAFEKYNIEKAIAIDNKEKPLLRAKANLSSSPYLKQIRFSKSSGLEDLREKVDAIIIAGLGGILIEEILKVGLKYHFQAKLILQANRNTADLRRFLWNQNYKLTSEKLVYEDGIYYEIMVAEKGEGKEDYNENDFLFGPILRKERSVLFLEKLKKDLHAWEAIPKKSKIVEERIEKIKEELC